MVFRLSTLDADFEPRFQALLGLKREVSEDVNRATEAIVADIRARGDAALAEYSRRFDRIDFAKVPMRVSAAAPSPPMRRACSQAAAVSTARCSEARNRR